MDEIGDFMKKIKLFLCTLVLLAGVKSASADLHPPTIKLGNSLQSGATIYISSATVLSLNAGTLAASGTVTLGGSANSVTVSTNITFSPTTAGIVGTTTNDNVFAGGVGQSTISVIAGDVNYGTSGQYADGPTLLLGAGDWDLTAVAYENSGGATLVTLVGLGISLTSGNSSAGLVTGDNFLYTNLTSTFIVNQIIPAFRVSLNTPTQYYMKVTANYSGTTPTFRGRMSARRVR